MSHEHEKQQPEELAAIERALAACTPAPPRVDRDRLMFQAGLASAMASGGRESPAGFVGEKIQPIGKLTHPARLWPAATAALAATSLALAIALWARPEPKQQIVYLDRVITVTAPAVAIAAPAQALEQQPATALAARSTSLASSSNNYLHTREVALRLGLDALGRPQSGQDRERASTYGDWLESLFPPAAVDGHKLDQFPQM
jgi:hypothetical protein